MKSPELNKLKKAMEKTLDAKRYDHSIGVAYTAAALAMKYQVDINSALIAGILHDCAKCISDEKKISLCEKNNLNISDTESKNPSLLHAKVGSLIAMKEYNIKDNDILNAIHYHTTGRPGMTDLEKIIFISDYIEPSRKQAPNLEDIRKMAFIDLNQTMILILKDTLDYLSKSQKPIDNATQETYDFYINESEYFEKGE